MLEPSSFLSRVPHLPPHPAAWENGDDAQRGCPQEDGTTVSGPKMRDDAWRRCPQRDGTAVTQT